MNASQTTGSAEPTPSEPATDHLNPSSGPTSPILFLHIPRTAGFSLKQMVEWGIGAERSLLDAHALDVDDIRRHISDLSFIEAHAAASFFRSLVGNAWPRCGLTILRDPVARSVSQVRHLRAGSMPFRSAPWYWDGLRDRVKNPEEVFERIPRLSNLQTRMLAARELDSATLDDRALTDAKTLIESITFGLTEEFVTSIAMIGERHRIVFPPIASANVSPPQGDDDLRSVAFMEAAAAHNSLDLALYAHAVGLLHARVERHCSDLLELNVEEAALDIEMKVLRKPFDTSLLVEREGDDLQVRGWLLLAGSVADAVLIRVGDRVTPAVCRVLSMRAASQTRHVDARFAGVRGTVGLPEGAEELEVIAFDRTRGLCGRRSFPLVRPTGSRRGSARRSG